MNLMPYQMNLLKKEYERNIDELKSLVESEKERLEGKTIKAENGETYDDQSHKAITNLKLRNKEIFRLLDTASVINCCNENQVSAASTFNVIFIDDDTEEETFTLIEEKVSTESSIDGFVTLNSDFGTAVHRKKVNETFAYRLENDYLVSGIITKIYTKEEQSKYFKSKAQEKQKKYTK